MSLIARQHVVFGMTDSEMTTFVNTGQFPSQGAWAGLSDPIYGGIGPWMGPIGPGAGATTNAPGLSSGATDTSSRFMRLINVPERERSSGAVTAIMIAKDSPLEALDLYIGGAGARALNRHRISVGSPFIGAIGENDHVWAAPVRHLPMLGARYDNAIQAAGIMSRAEFMAQTVVWGCDIGTFPGTMWNGGAGAYTLAAPLLPAIVEIYRGELDGLAAQQQRAPVHATLAWRITDRGDGQPTSPSLYVITDGRRRVRVEAAQVHLTADIASYAVEGVGGYSTIEGTEQFAPTDVQGGIDAPFYDPLVAATQLSNDATKASRLPQIYDYIGNPYFAFKVTITGALVADPNKLRGYINVSAWDQ